jgi:hypothetical protein
VLFVSDVLFLVEVPIPIDDTVNNVVAIEYKNSSDICILFI